MLSLGYIHTTLTFAAFWILLTNPTHASGSEKWRDYILEEEACVEDPKGRLSECDFEGFSNTELKSLLKQVLESKTLNNPMTSPNGECKLPSSGGVALLEGAKREISEGSRKSECAAQLVDGMDVMISKTGVRMIFGTPIFLGQIPAATGISKGIISLVKRMEKQQKGVGSRKSSRGSGFRTTDNFLEIQEPIVASLAQFLMRFSKHVWQFGRGQPFSGAKLALKGWANILRKGAHHTIHVHPQAVWSGVYYAKVPKGVGEYQRGWEDPSQGCLVLMDPRPQSHMSTISERDTQFVEKMEVCPTEGMVVMFPSWMSHFVPYIETKGERIAVSFNVHAIPIN
ncbi:hypothetical protein AAMO2058_001038900 [Amorphochlora amoebiformis]